MEPAAWQSGGLGDIALDWSITLQLKSNMLWKTNWMGIVQVITFL
jgi:hypothetical protein